jgi:hypothetical protein
MRKSFFRLALFAAVLSMVAACQKEDDDGPVNQPLARDKFLTTDLNHPWVVHSQHSPSGQSRYWNLIIVAGSTSNEILLKNFDEMGSSNYVRATMTGDNSFEIPQQIGPPDSTIYQGDGNFITTNSSLSFTYTADDQANPVDHVSATATR